MCVSNKGEIIVGLKCVPPDPNSKKRTKGTFLLLVKDAKNLQAIKSNGSSDPFCKRWVIGWYFNFWNTVVETILVLLNYNKNKYTLRFNFFNQCNLCWFIFTPFPVIYYLIKVAVPSRRLTWPERRATQTGTKRSHTETFLRTNWLSGVWNWLFGTTIGWAAMNFWEASVYHWALVIYFLIEKLPIYFLK
jgi:hypothetical protein